MSFGGVDLSYTGEFVSAGLKGKPRGNLFLEGTVDGCLIFLDQGAHIQVNTHDEGGAKGTRNLRKPWLLLGNILDFACCGLVVELPNWL